jgi:hypothetical protein
LLFGCSNGQATNVWTHRALSNGRYAFSVLEKRHKNMAYSGMFLCDECSLSYS